MTAYPKPVTLLTTQSLIAIEREYLRFRVEEFRQTRQAIRDSSLHIAHVNELAMKLFLMGWKVSSMTTTTILIRADKGCEAVMRTIAQLECAGYLFDYDKIKFDGIGWIDTQAALAEPDARLPEITISFNMSDTPSCAIVEEVKYEMQPVKTKRLVCPS